MVVLLRGGALGVGAIMWDWRVVVGGCGLMS